MHTTKCTGTAESASRPPRPRGIKKRMEWQHGRPPGARRKPALCVRNAARAFQGMKCEAKSTYNPPEGRLSRGPGSTGSIHAR
eukprot:scaffold1368_cov333-Pavlova_lutheri.AAC.18